MEKSQPHNTQDIEPLKDNALDADEWQRQHDEVSISLRRTMITLLGYSFFCMLTLAAPDVSLIAKDAKIKVPFAGTEVSYQAFLIIGPLTMIGLAIYLHILLGHSLSLGKHKDTLGLPYIFNIDNKAANWLANFIFYWLPCLVLVYFSWKALPRPSGSFLLITLTAIFFTCMVLLRISRFPADRHLNKFNFLYFFGWVLGVCLLLGPKIGFYERNLDLFRVDLSKKDLRHTDIVKANLVEADLNGANLSEANLSGAVLSKANLWGANLSKANLSRANLSEAVLSKAPAKFKLWGHTFIEVNLLGDISRKVNLSGADLSEAVLSKANLSGANLSGAVLSKANLWGADLSEADLSGANLSEAVLPKANLSGANLSGADLRGADLSEATMGIDDLLKVVLEGARIASGVKLEEGKANKTGANLSEADLRGAKNLTAGQLCKASILYETKLDPELQAQIKQECPDLLKIPQFDDLLKMPQFDMR